MKKIVVIGSCNTDMVIKVAHLPLPGETIIGHDFMTNQGGKGANQAVAVARMGGETLFIARLGDDGFGRQSLSLLNEEGIDTRFVTLTKETPTGVALIPVDEKGENSIIVASGANALLSENDVNAAQTEICQAKILLMQLETPVQTLSCAAEMAHQHGVTVILNPAPFPEKSLPAELLRNVDLIILNETEAAAMSGVEVKDADSALQAIRRIRELGVKQVIITAGGSGAYTEEKGKLIHVPAFNAEVIDTTAAGDTFCGALCVALSRNYEYSEAISIANKAASISVTRMGAWRSIPFAAEVFGK
ncbi:MAG: ribokinase [Bacteroidaceae bacterium]|nr:ribokinase [Bacteroidaceae bacterium]